MIALIQIEPFQVLETFVRMPEPAVWPDGSLSHGIEPGFVRENNAYVGIMETPDRPGEYYSEASRSQIFNGKNIVVTVEWQPDLDRAKRELLNAVDSNAEQTRVKYITPGYGQAMVYMQKEQEALAYQQNPQGDFPLLSASVGIDGAGIGDVASLVLGTLASWRGIAAKIEAIRLSAKQQIKQAQTVEDALAAYNQAVWP